MQFLLTLTLAAFTQAPAPDTVDDLKPLAPLVGEWVAESRTPDGRPVVREITYQWIYDGKYLRAESERKIGDDTVKMTILYLRDPASRKVRAWVISSDGSWSQADVTISNETIQLDSIGVGADGSTASMISTLKTLPDGTRTETWTEIMVAGKPQPSPPSIVWSRKKAPGTDAK